MTYREGENFQCPYCEETLSDSIETWMKDLEEKIFWSWTRNICGNEFSIMNNDDGTYKVIQ